MWSMGCQHEKFIQVLTQTAHTYIYQSCLMREEGRGRERERGREGNIFAYTIKFTYTHTCEL